MKYNNGDMDDLFRRASERYPLRTDSADWDKLESALDGGPADSSDEQDRRRRRGVFWWFLLIPLAGIGYLMWQMGGSRMAHAHAGTVGVAQRTEKAGVAAGAGNAGVGAGTSGRSASGVGAGTSGGGAGNVGAGEPGGGHTGNGRSTAVVDPGNLRGGRGNQMLTEGNRKQTSVGGEDATAGDVTGSNGTHAGIGTHAGMGSLDQDPLLALLDLRRAPIGERHAIFVDVVAPKAAVDEKPAEKKRAGKKPDSLKRSHGYIGVFGAPDFSTVRFQAMKGVGTTFGVMLGYSFNARWAVETGLSMDRKNYYTIGEYFKKEMPSGYMLKNVDGICNMLEIPVNVRYNFSTGSRMRWFATAGLSTYLMSRETYNYEVEYNWVTEDSMWNIHKPSQYWFSIVNLSAGFEQRMGKIGKLRLEPYVRIPLSGIGTGKLPIVSGGLNIGFVRDLW